MRLNARISSVASSILKHHFLAIGAEYRHDSNLQEVQAQSNWEISSLKFRTPKISWYLGTYGRTCTKGEPADSGYPDRSLLPDSC